MSVTPPSSKQNWAAQRERGNTFALKLMSWIALHLGRRVSRFVLFFIVLYFFLTAPKARRSSAQYMQRVTQQPAGIAAVFKHLYAFSAVTLDRVYFLNDRMDLFNINVADGHNVALDTAKSGKGLILMGAHLGSFESVRSVARGYESLKMVLLMYEENARNIKQLLAAINPEAQQNIISLGRPGAMLEVRDQLSQGALIGVLADRTLEEQGNEAVSFFGSKASFPLGPFRMAAMLRHPMYFMVGLYHGANRYSVHIEPIMDFSQNIENRDAAIHQALNRYVQLIEQFCQQAPYNWFNFFDFWEKSAHAHETI